jgi:hypothetical protein
MRIQLRSIEHGPAALPPWQFILEDLADPPVRRVARVLGVSQRSVYRWNASGNAPRMACLALFWLTRWGQSLVHTNAANDAQQAVGLVVALTRERDCLAVEVDQLRALVRPGERDAG